MATTIDRSDLLRRVEDVLVDALGVDSDEITESATLSGDLGAESIDFLDIVFRLEKTFSIKISKGELFPDDILNNQDLVENGKITSEGLEQLKRTMPHANFSEFEKDPAVAKVPDLFTVNTIVNYVENKLRAA